MRIRRIYNYILRLCAVITFFLLFFETGSLLAHEASNVLFKCKGSFGCQIQIDGEEIVEILPHKIKKISLLSGEHLLEFKPTDKRFQSYSVEQVISVGTNQSVIKIKPWLSLSDVLKEAIKGSINVETAERIVGGLYTLEGKWLDQKAVGDTKEEWENAGFFVGAVKVRPKYVLKLNVKSERIGGSGCYFHVETKGREFLINNLNVVFKDATTGTRLYRVTCAK